jgi:hypothetical protein
MSESADSKDLVQRIELDGIHRDIRDMKSLLTSMVETMQRLSIIEERQNTMVQSSNRLFSQIESIVSQQQKLQVTDALNANMSARLSSVETAFRELHVENERNKARFSTFRWLLNGAWVAGGAVVAVLLWLIANVGPLLSVSSHAYERPPVQVAPGPTVPSVQDRFRFPPTPK